MNEQSLQAITSMLRFKHSGRMGDLLYALPIIKTLGGGDLVVGVNVPGAFEPDHPSGALQITEDTYRFTLPFLRSLEYLTGVSCLYHGGSLTATGDIDYDLDAFRELPSRGIDLRYGHIPEWYSIVTGAQPDLTAAWINIERCDSSNLVRRGVLDTVRQSIIVNLTPRYRNRAVSYSFLSSYPCIFVGLECEYKAFQTIVPGAKYVCVENLLELASVIAHGRLFVGNQSAAFAIAEGLKVKRVLERSLGCPNVDPRGGRATAIVDQEALEAVVHSYYGETN